jgi:endonuclease/exonuclease/phosphatase family metal-dependent hydrolase
MRRTAGLVLGLVLLAAACSSSAKSSGGGSATPTLRVVTQNILHGSACPATSDGCALPARVELFTRQLDAAGCPELVGMQEVNPRIVTELRARLPKICSGRYRLVSDADPGNDREVVLSTLPVVGSQRIRLAGPLRTALWVRASGDAGIVDFFTTHLASSSDDRPCDTSTCPAPCQADDMLNACQAREVIAFAEQNADPDAIAVIAGDLNAKPGEPTITAFRDAGYRDAQLAAGVAECKPSTGAQCTSGRIDDAMTDLTDPTSKQIERLDYVWLRGRRDCNIVAPTGLFNAEPAQNGPSGLAFPSDHTGVVAVLQCPTTAAQQSAAAGVTMPTLPSTTTVVAVAGDAATKAAITSAFTTVFDGSVTSIDKKLAAIEDADRLRPFFLQSYAAQKAIAARIKVRIDRINVTDATHADVEYSLLLDGAAVLDHLPGGAVKIGDEWFVTRKTYCDVSTQGAKTIPEPCQS